MLHKYTDIGLKIVEKLYIEGLCHLKGNVQKVKLKEIKEKQVLVTGM